MRSYAAHPSDYRRLLMCDSPAAAPRGYTASPFNGAVDRGARQHQGITLVACDRRQL
jgi:hypothetical protein